MLLRRTRRRSEAIIDEELPFLKGDNEKAIRWLMEYAGHLSYVVKQKEEKKFSYLAYLSIKPLTYSDPSKDDACPNYLPSGNSWMRSSHF